MGVTFLRDDGISTIMCVGDSIKASRLRHKQVILRILDQQVLAKYSRNVTEMFPNGDIMHLAGNVT